MIVRLASFISHDFSLLSLSRVTLCLALCLL